ncbi:MAG TPA: hypothetical protein VNA25_29075, partial [Phycisphaerae bacterium]|nr:hypothetical protein [Phycisphaerae bacterium]
MSCRAVKKWVWRHGAAELPPSLIGHVEECGSCQALLSEVRVLDGAVGRDGTPDPGEAYWANFAPRLARRLDEAAQPVITVIPAPWRWRLVRRWAPVTGIAILAVLLGRSVIDDQAPPSSFDSKVPVESAVLTDIVRESQKQASGELATRSDDPTVAEQQILHS